MKKAIIILILLAVATPAWAVNDVMTTKAGFIASMSREDLDKATDYQYQKDFRAMALMVQANRLIILKAGIKVYIVDRRLWDGYVKIRPVGKTIELWTPHQAVE